MARWLLVGVLSLCIIFPVHAGVVHDSELTWYTVETDHFRIHFHDGSEEIVQRFWPIAEAVHDEISLFLNWEPVEKTDVVLTDEYDVSNGFASVFPTNTITLYIAAPDSINSLEDHGGWLEYVFRHEYLHIVQSDKVTGTASQAQSVLGRHPFLFPNTLQPLWFLEGLATYVETDEGQGIGRGQSSYFDMMMRVEVIAGLKPLNQVNQPISSWPAGSTTYLYGVHYYQFVQEKYGEKSIVESVEHYSNNLWPFRINTNSEEVFNKDLEQMWDEYSLYLGNKYLKKATQIKAQGVREGKQLTSDGYFTGSLRHVGDRLSYFNFDGQQHPSIKSLNFSEKNTAVDINIIHDVNYDVRFDVHPEKGYVIAQAELCNNARYYFDLYRLEKGSNKLQRLTTCARYREVAWSPDGENIIVVHNESGLNALYLLNDQGERVDLLWQGKDKEQIGQLSWSPAGDKLVASVWRRDKGWNIELFDINNKSWTGITNDTDIQTQASFNHDGSELTYSADYDGVYNIYLYSIKEKQTYKLTNVLGGAFYPVLDKETLYYIGYNNKGFDVYKLDKPQKVAIILPELELVDEIRTTKKTKRNVTKVKEDAPDELSQLADDFYETNSTEEQEPVINGPLAVEFPDPDKPGKKLSVREYSVGSSLKPRWWTPFVLVDDQRTEIGFSTSATDVLRRHSYNATIIYDTDNSWLLGNVYYTYDGLWPIIRLGFSRNTDLFLSNGVASRIRQEEQASFEVILPFYQIKDKHSLHLVVLQELEKDIWTSPATIAANNTEDNILAIAYRFTSAQKYPLSVSRNNGREVRLIFEDSDVVGNSTAKGQITVLDWREFIPLGGEHVLALRFVEGRSHDTPTLFRLGGNKDDNSFVTELTGTSGDAFINKRDYSLRGYDEGLAVLRGRNMRLASIEYRFPISRIERGAMTPPVGINQIHGNVFYELGGVWGSNQSSPQDYYASTGIEFGTDIDLFYNLRINAALGFSTGLDDTYGEDKIYLRIGSQF